MDQNKLEQFARQYARVITVEEQQAGFIPGRAGPKNLVSGLVIEEWLERDHTCTDCGRQLTQAPIKNYSLRATGWREHCRSCSKFSNVKEPEPIPEPEPVIECEPEPIPEPRPEDRLLNTTIVPSECGLGQVIERHYHGSLIREFVRNPETPPTLPVADQDSHI